MLSEVRNCSTNKGWTTNKNLNFRLKINKFSLLKIFIKKILLQAEFNRKKKKSSSVPPLVNRHLINADTRKFKFNYSLIFYSQEVFHTQRYKTMNFLIISNWVSAWKSLRYAPIRSMNLCSIVGQRIATIDLIFVIFAIGWIPRRIKFTLTLAN